MLKMSRISVIVIVGIVIFSVQTRCPARQRDAQKLVSPKLLEHVRLKMLWQYQMPLKQKETLVRLLILGDRLYAFSDSNYLVSLDRHKRTVIFSRPFEPTSFTLHRLELYEDKLLSVVGNRLIEIHPEYGTEISGARIGYGVTCPVARNKSFFYIAGADGRLRALRAEDKVKIFEVAAENESVIVSVVAGDDHVVFATEAGNVICITPDGPKRRWQFDAADSIVGPIVRDSNSLYVASKDTYIYKLKIGAGAFPVWKYQTGAILDKAPRTTREVVYQYVHYKGLTAIDKETGKFMWQLPEGVDLLAEADGKAYVIADPPKLVVMDNKKAKRLYSINLASVTAYAPNLVDGKIYIGDDGGRIACLEPLK